MAGGLGSVSSLLSAAGDGGVVLLRRCALLREVAPPETGAEKGTDLPLENGPKAANAQYRICPYGEIGGAVTPRQLLQLGGNGYYSAR